MGNCYSLSRGASAILRAALFNSSSSLNYLAYSLRRVFSVSRKAMTEEG